MSTMTYEVERKGGEPWADTYDKARAMLGKKQAEFKEEGRKIIWGKAPAFIESGKTLIVEMPYKCL